ncbi:argininosuccinate lyase [Mucisphaera sp.]|uniref:argininosuccinate lyase n=1 Tax=Mucisphaera sp. TaxID=2913024 RepID=UPI003D0A119C
MTTPTSKPWEHAKSSGSETDPLAARFVSSIDYDWRLYKQDIRGSIAHATMLEKVGLITADDLAAITKGLKEIEAEIDQQGRAWPGFTYELEDIHMCVEAALIERTGEPGRKLHTGRSRNDQVALDLMMWIKQAVVTLQSKFDELESSIDELRAEYGSIVMPSYTHLQRAQPICVEGELAAWREAFVGCSDRFTALIEVSNQIPLGSGAIAGSSLPLDRHALEWLLANQFGAGKGSSPTEFDRQRPVVTFNQIPVTWNSIHATASRDMACDFVYACSMTSQWLSRWAEQWIIYASTEFSFIKLDDAYTTGSSMMPQKQNPDMLELVRGKCGSVYGSLVALLTTLKGLTVGYNRDLQEDKKHVFRAFDDLCDCLDMAAKMMRGTTFLGDKINSSLGRGYLDATSLADYLVTKGVPFRTSHQIVGRLVHECEDTGVGELKKLPLERMQTESDLIEDDVYDWLGADNVVKRYQTLGHAGLGGYPGWPEEKKAD